MINKMKYFAVLFVFCACVLGAFGAADSAHAAPENTRVLILPFELNTPPDLLYLENTLPDMIGQRLSSKKFQVVSQAELATLLQQNKVQTIDIAAARQLARAAGADYAVYGSFTQLGDSISIDARLVEALGISSALPLYISKDGLINLLPAVEELSEKISYGLQRQERIAKITIRGTKVLDPDVVLMRIDTRKDDLINPKKVNDEVKKIYNLGYFNDVNASIQQGAEGLELIYTVVEKPRIDVVTVQGSDEVDLDDILAVMNTKTGSVLNERLLAEDIQKITELYREKGYYLAKVSHTVSNGVSSASLILTVEEGNKLYIKDIRLLGAEQLDKDDVLDQIQLSTHGMFSWFTKSGILREDYLEHDVGAIGAYYLNHGFMDVRVASPEIVYEEDGIIVSFAVSEGTRYRVDNITFTGDLLEPDARLRELIVLDDYIADETYFNYTVIQEDLKKLTEFYNDYGYAFADCSFRTERLGDDSVNIHYVLTKKQKVYIRRVEVEGNLHTRDNVIRREMRMTDGDMFEGAKLRRSHQRLNNLGYFAQSDIEIVPTENPEEVDLKIKVKEKNTGAISAGIGYSTFNSIGVGGSVSEQNLFGKGYYGAFSAMFSGRSNAFNLDFVNPRYNDTDLQLGMNAYLKDEDWTDYDKDTVGFVASAAHPIGEYTSVRGYYRLDQYTYSNVADDATRSIRDREGDNIASVVGASITRNTVDNFVRPTEGTVIRLAADYGGGIIQGSDHFITLSSDLRAYYQLADKHVLHARLRSAAVFENDSTETIPVHERIYLGGINSMRGYERDDLSPRDPQTGDVIGGTRSSYANLEYIWFMEDEMGIYLVPFIDTGFVVDPDMGHDYLSEIKTSTGLEVRWQSPLGNLRFAYGFPLNEVNGKKRSGKFEFTMGQSF